MNCPRLRHSRSDSSGKHDENCQEAHNKKVQQMPLNQEFSPQPAGKEWDNNACACAKRGSQARSVRKKKIGLDTKHSTTTSPLTVVARAPAKNLKEGPKPSKRSVAPKGWPGGLLTGCVKVELHSACVPPFSRASSHVPTHCSCTHRGSPASPCRSPLVGDRQSAALPDWTCFGAATWCPQVVFLPASTKGLEQRVGRLSHDRTTERHWQRLGSTRSTSRGPSTNAAAHATSPQGSCCAIIPSPSRS